MGNHAGAGSARPQRSTRVQDVLREWEHDATHRMEYAPRTVRQAMSAMLHLAKSAGEDDIRELTTAHVLEWLMLQKSPRTAMHQRTMLSMVFRYARMKGIVATCPSELVLLPRSSPGRGADRITLQEAAAVIHAAERDVGDRRKTGAERARFYLFLWATGLRFGDARRQCWEDIDWTTGFMRITKNKGRRNDGIQLAKWFIPILREYPRGGDLIFTRAPSPKSLAKDYRAAGVTGKGLFHRWRKGPITLLAELGVPIYEIQRFSRHRSLNVLANSYIQTDCRQLQAAQRFMEIRRLGS